MRQALAEIRRATGPGGELIQTDRDHIWIPIGKVEFADQVGRASGCALFEDLDHLTPEFDSWLTIERAHWVRQTMAGLREQARGLLRKNRPGDALAVLARMEELDPLDEEVLRLAMEAERQAGRSARIEQRFRDMEERLQGELGVGVSMESRELRRQLLSSESSSVPNVGREPPSEKQEPDPAGITTLQDKGISRRGNWRAVFLVAGALSVATIAAALFNAPDSAPKRIAVLPFSTAGMVDPSAVDGFSGELLSQLSRNPYLRVTGRDSSWQVRPGMNPQRVGRQLDVDYLISGKVLGANQRMRVDVAVIQTKDGRQLWSQSFPANWSAMESVQAAVGGAVSQALKVEPLLAPRGASSNPAYTPYLRAKGLIRHRSVESSRSAYNLLLEAIRLRPNFAPAWAQLSGAIYFMGERSVSLDPQNPQAPRITQFQAARRALALDPDLAEAHAMMALVLALRGPEARRHLQRAMELDQGDTQTSYWWAVMAGKSGDYGRAMQIARDTAVRDPLWHRPVAMVAGYALEAGDLARVRNHLGTLRSGNPDAALELESDLAYAAADYSRVMQLWRRQDRKSPIDGDFKAIASLVELGYGRRAALLNPVLVEEYCMGASVPALPKLLVELKKQGEGDKAESLVGVLQQLSKERRWADIAAIYDAKTQHTWSLRSTDASGREERVMFGPVIALALQKVGRHREAMQVALLARRDAQFMLANGPVPSHGLAAIAKIEALLGERERALTHLEQAFAKGWRLFERSPTLLGDVPEFATIRDDRRFKRLGLVQVAHLAKERREVAELGLI